MGKKRLYVFVAALLISSLLCFYQVKDAIMPSYFKRPDSSNLPSIVETNSSETLKSNNVSLKIDDVLITVKTSSKNYKTRIELILKTWFKSANGKILFISDDRNAEYLNKTGGMLFDAHCGRTHNLVDLCCKTDAEFQRYLASPDKKWWCHFDDDQFVNIERLLEFLEEKDWRKPWYIGRLSVPLASCPWEGKEVEFQFGTGGAGYCLSQPVLKKMGRWIGNGTFPKTCQMGQAADDVVIGFIAMGLLKVPLFESKLFWSHMQMRNEIPPPKELHKQITLSYQGETVIDVEPLKPRFTKKEDPTRLLSLHCHLHPVDKICA